MIFIYLYWEEGKGRRGRDELTITIQRERERTIIAHLYDRGCPSLCRACVPSHVRMYSTKYVLMYRLSHGTPPITSSLSAHQGEYIDLVTMFAPSVRPSIITLSRPYER